MVVGHVAPEAQVGGMIGLLEEGDSITIDIGQRLLQANVSKEEIRKRKEKWQAPPQKYTAGVIAKYAKLVSTASRGAVTD